MNKLKRYFRWLWRIGYCRGFGVQSPRHTVSSAMSSTSTIRIMLIQTCAANCPMSAGWNACAWSCISHCQLPSGKHMVLLYGGDTALLKRYVSSGCKASSCTRWVQTKGKWTENGSRETEEALIRPVEGSEDFSRLCWSILMDTLIFRYR